MTNQDIRKMKINKVKNTLVKYGDKVTDENMIELMAQEGTSRRTAKEYLTVARGMINNNAKFKLC